MTLEDPLLILTPVKNAAKYLDGYFSALATLTYPAHLLSLGFLESDSTDSTHSEIEQRLPALEKTYRRASLWKKDFGFQLLPGVPRWAWYAQVARRSVLAKSRNHLLFRALDDEAWVLWLDVDVIEYPCDVVEKLLATGKEIVHPNCVYEYGGRSFDLNAWRDNGQNHLDDLRPEGELVKLDAVGGTMLLVKADLHRDGLIFPPFPYGLANKRIRQNNTWLGELETEGMGIMASDMGASCWGMPHLEIKHSSE